MHTDDQRYDEDARQSMEDIRRSAEERYQHAKHICDESAIIQEIARELRHLSQLARHRRRKQRMGRYPLLRGLDPFLTALWRTPGTEGAVEGGQHRAVRPDKGEHQE